MVILEETFTSTCIFYCFEDMLHRWDSDWVKVDHVAVGLVQTIVTVGYRRFISRVEHSGKIDAVSNKLEVLSRVR